MVQAADKRIRLDMGIGKFFRRLIEGIKKWQSPIESLPLEFHMDVDEHGQHIVHFYYILEGQPRKITDIRKLWHYGNVVELEGRYFTLSPDDLEILLALKSLNPTLRKDDALVCEIVPPILKYLRNHEGKVRETEDSKAVEISDEILQPAVEVHYIRDQGLIVKAGYYGRKSDKLLKESELEKKEYGRRKYVKIGSTFYPLPSDLDPEIQEWIESEEKVIPHDKIPEFFKRDLVLLKTQMRAVLTEEASKIEILDGPIQPLISIEVEAPGWLEFKVEYVSGGFKIPDRIFKNRQKKGYVQVNENTWVLVDEDVQKMVLHKLRGLGAVKTPQGYRLPLMRFSSLEEFIKEIGGLRVVEEEYRQFLERLEGFEADEGFELPHSIETMVERAGITLRPYQRAGIHWLTWLTQSYLHGILADDMGLGKTLQTILAMRLAYESEEIKNPSLVICPKSVIHFWERELERFFPFRGEVYHGPYRNRDVWHHPGARIYITNYETAANDIDILKQVPFYFVVVDEASYIKNPRTKRTKAIKALNAVHRIAITGTPIENRPSELWSIFDFLMRGYLGSFDSFLKKYEKPLLQGELDEKTAELLAKRIRPFVLRRTKDQVAKELPEKIEMEEWCELTDEQKFLYNEIQRRKVKSIREKLLAGEKVDVTTSILPIITKLKQVCDHPAIINGDKHKLYGRSEKFDLIMKKLEQILERGKAAVVFSHFLDMLDIFQKALEKKGVSFIRIQGSTENRGALIEWFNEGKAQVALCSLRAAGHGITLTAANHVFHVDRWWNPAVEDQATDRVHRIGQDKTVYVYRILTQGTLEERICKLLEKKKGIADSVIGAVTGQEMHWTREELLELLEPLE
ncbi:MAG: DEAD/DEAH box helicase [Deltaproteobacteria bacterium]|nr:DEAD/DEAH box helicase [Deltaproteobacteria bacterium]